MKLPPATPTKLEVFEEVTPFKVIIAISGAKSKKLKGVKLGISKIANYNSNWITLVSVCLVVSVTL